jgi:type II secretory ATPase GspE/PulE/Tfp pilus assembly ATPase PilB-like protein
LRYRVDGALMDATPPTKKHAGSARVALKIMSNLNIAERRLPQDGRIRVRVSGKDIDLRVSFLPTVHGEKCVLRVLDKTNLSASIEKLVWMWIRSADSSLLSTLRTVCCW